jgi:hypothetical protein
MFQTLIASATVGSGGAASIDFSAIPQTYTDLTLVLSARATSTTAAITVAFNGSSASFTGRNLIGNGTTVTSATTTTLIGNACISSNTASTFGNLQLVIPNYAGSTNKVFSVTTVTENNNTTAFQQLFAGLWSNTAAITQVTLSLANFAEFSTAYLYGTLKGSGGATVTSS